MHIAGALANRVDICNIHTLVLDNNNLALVKGSGSGSAKPQHLVGASALADMLAVNTSLKKLSLNGCRLGSDGVIMLSESLAKNKSLISLHLGSNSCGDGAYELNAPKKPPAAFTASFSLTRAQSATRKRHQTANASTLHSQHANTPCRAGRTPWLAPLQRTRLSRACRFGKMPF